MYGVCVFVSVRKCLCMYVCDTVLCVCVCVCVCACMRGGVFAHVACLQDITDHACKVALFTVRDCVSLEGVSLCTFSIPHDVMCA